MNLYNIQKHHLSYYQCCFRIRACLWYTNYIEIMERNNGLLRFQWQIKNNWFDLYLGPGSSLMSPLILIIVRQSKMWGRYTYLNIECFLKKCKYQQDWLQKTLIKWQKSQNNLSNSQYLVIIFLTEILTV